MPTGPPAPKRRWALAPLAAGIAALLIVIAAGAWYFLADWRSTPGEAARLSIVVLPFANLSNDPAQDYFADGVTENLTTELSRLHNSFVIARNTAFTFKGKNLDARSIGKELGVRYVLEGSVQRDANRVRVNAQLIDAESGAHLWADRFEEDVADLFKLQDEVVGRLAPTLQIELVNAEAQRSLHDRSLNPDAIDLTMRGLALVNQPLTKASYYEARVKICFRLHSPLGLCAKRPKRSFPVFSGQVVNPNRPLEVKGLGSLKVDIALWRRHFRHRGRGGARLCGSARRSARS
jgi:TolB-like protein